MNAKLAWSSAGFALCGGVALEAGLIWVALVLFGIAFMSFMISTDG